MVEPQRDSHPQTTPAGPSPRVLVIGCGNPLAGDDGAGSEILRRLRARGGCDCELWEMPQAGVQLLTLFEDAEVILFVDAVSSGAPAGTLHLVPLPGPGLELRPLSALSSHGWGLAETLGLARALRRRIPRLMLLGVEVERVSVGVGLSSAVEQAIDAAVEQLPRLCRSLLAAPATS